MTEYTFDNDLPRLNHTKIPLGVGHVIKWGFGEANAPEDLSGRSAMLILNPGRTNQVPLTLTTDSQWATFQVDSHDWDSNVYPYALLVAVSPGSSTLQGRVRGTLTRDLKVLPPVSS